MRNFDSYTVTHIVVALLIFVMLIKLAYDLRKGRNTENDELKSTIDSQSKSFREEADRSREAILREISAFRQELNHGNEERSRTLNEALAARSLETNEALFSRLELLAKTQATQSEYIAGTLAKQSDSITGTLATNRAETAKTFAEIRQSLEKSLTQLRDENSKKLDEMRSVVDEKLQTTLERRIGESFKNVSERLENVHKALGEMQTFASSVGDLKRVLTNVKSRGTWGEIRLGALLEEMLTRDQFVHNVKPIPRRDSIVEFAIKLPGGEETGGRPLYLPIDSKFPIEDYRDIVEAAEKGDGETVASAGAKLGKTIESFARDIRNKYICPPYTTDFAILFLPTEGLFAEIMRLPGVAEKIQRECRVTIACPSTLAAFLNSLQMGFRTLVIQKNSAEIAKTLSSVKKEFLTFGELLTKVSKKLSEAQNTIEDTTRRHNIATKKLEKVETFELETKTDLALED